MNDVEFIGLLNEVSGKFEVARNELISEWAPDVVPITTQFEALGECAARNIHLFDQDVCESLFELVERGIVEGDVRLRTAVCTGFVEALVTMRAKDSSEWRAIRSRMGAMTGAHADAWLGDPRS